MSGNEKKRIPLMDKLWAEPLSPDEKPQLLGSRCKYCSEIYFPVRKRDWCIHCQKQGLEEIRLGPKGKIASFTVVMQQPGGGYYKGPVPYAYGIVELPEGVKVKSLFETDDFEDLKVGGEVELTIGKLHENEEGQEVETFKFKPVQKREEG